MRKAKPKKRVILPDPVFNDQKVSKFVNHLMYDGKKNTSYEIFYNALDTVKAKMANEEKSALEIWKQALDNITPQVEVKSRRIGGATFQVPTEIRPDRKESISMKNLISFARKRVVRLWQTSLLLRLWMLITIRVALSSVRRICIVWLRLTVHLLTSDSNLIYKIGLKENGKSRFTFDT